MSDRLKGLIIGAGLGSGSRLSMRRFDKLQAKEVPGATPKTVLKSYIHDSINVRDIEGAQPTKLYPV